MSNSTAAHFPAPLIYPAPSPSQESIEQEAAAGLQKNLQSYQWAQDSRFPPYAAAVPPGIDSKSLLQIFNIQALLQTGGMLPPKNYVSGAYAVSKDYSSLAPESVPTSLDDLIKYNQSLRAPPGVEKNMFFRFNIGMFSLCDRRKGDWHSDAVFAQQHFTGTNATTITLANEWIAAFKEGAEATQNTEMLNHLRDAPASSLYVQDYSYFRSAMGLSETEELTSGDGRFGAAPVALFQLEDNGHLHPLAIVIDYKGSISLWQMPVPSLSATYALVL